MRKKSGNQTLTLALSGMMAALVFVATYFFKLPVSITQGYIHLGDGFILLGASLLVDTLRYGLIALWVLALYPFLFQKAEGLRHGACPEQHGAA